MGLLFAERILGRFLFQVSLPQDESIPAIEGVALVTRGLEVWCSEFDGVMRATAPGGIREVEEEATSPPPSIHEDLIVSRA